MAAIAVRGELEALYELPALHFEEVQGCSHLRVVEANLSLASLYTRVTCVSRECLSERHCEGSERQIRGRKKWRSGALRFSSGKTHHLGATSELVRLAGR